MFFSKSGDFGKVEQPVRSVLLSDTILGLMGILPKPSLVPRYHASLVVGRNDGSGLAPKS